MILDFKEIPISNNSPLGNSDTFEFFAREFLETLGYNILKDPARGPDGGVDLIVSESTNMKEIKWLVSCKHYAKSGSTIGTTQEQNISDRIDASGCDGFMGFYSTHASQFLIDNLSNKTSKYGHYIFDSEKIERYIIGDLKFNTLLLRFFPESFKKITNLIKVGFPTELLNYYLEKENISIAIIDVVFKRRLFFAKAIIKHSNFESMLLEENVSLLTVDSLKGTIATANNVNKDSLDNLGILNDNIKVFIESIYPNSLFKLSAWSLFYGEYLLLSNILIIEKKYYAQLESDFDKIKSILRTI